MARTARQDVSVSTAFLEFATARNGRSCTVIEFGLSAKGSQKKLEFS